MTASIDHLHATKPDVVADETALARVARSRTRTSTRSAATTSTENRRPQATYDRCAASMTTPIDPC